MKPVRLSLALFSITLSLAFAAQADIRLDGYFIAQENCAAPHSIRKNTNPGDIHLTVNMAYEVISKNKADATHYRIKIDEASPSERWVAISCGKLLTDCHEQTSTASSQPTDPTSEPSTPSEEYFQESILLTDQVNNSALCDFFASNIGNRVTANEIMDKVEAAFGEGARDKVRIRCNDGMISEIWVNLYGKIEDDSKIGDLMQHAEQAGSSCQSGVIDPVGY